MSQSEQNLEAPAVVRQSDVPNAPRPTRAPRNQRQEPLDTQMPAHRRAGKDVLGADLPKDKAADRPARRPGEKAPADKETGPRKLSLRELFAPKGEMVDDPDAPPSNIAAAVKRLGMKDEEFDEMEISIGETGEPMKLKDLKGRVGKLVDFETRELKFEQRRVRQEGEILRGQQEFKALLELMPASAITPKLIDRVRRDHDAKVNRERELTIEHIPEWRKESVMSADIAGMEAYIQGYGYPKGYLATLVDHRALKMIRDNYLMNRRIEAALAEVEIPDDTNTTPSGKSKSSAAKPNLETNRNRRAGMRPTQRDKLRSMFTKE